MSHFSDKSKKRTVIAAIATGIIAVTALIVLLCLRHDKVEQPLIPVQTENVTTRDVNIYGDYVGRIRAQQLVEVRARVEGYLESMMFEEGTYIKKGQPLFIIDPTIYRANAKKAEAILNKAVASRDKAKRDLDRVKPLYEQNAASRLDLDNAIAAYETAKADVVVAEAELALARQTLSYTTVTSPISGYISERSADIGTLVGPGAKSLLATVVNSDTVRIDFSMTSLEYLKSRSRNVNLGQRDENRTWDPYVTVTMADGSVYPYRGLVDFADPKVDPKTGTFQVRAEMKNPDHALLPGEFTRVKLLMDVRENAIAIPTKSLEIEKGGAFVYVVKPDSIVERRFVETGPELDNTTVIERGLVKGEQIITEGFHKVKHGMKVAPNSSTAATTPEKQ
ncbi:MAG: efflux RND transporter periplasmic adaptor subunit [Clostridiales bacterium]|nr:efflux RND transporter periplasmic adaptor subunit [Clostridiales bacterium]